MLDIKDSLIIRIFKKKDQKEIINLWNKCDLVKPWNDSIKDILRKKKVQNELFLVGEYDNSIIASIMAGYDGHRGNIYYLAVDCKFRKNGIGKLLMNIIEKKLLMMSCPKINLTIRNTNLKIENFYKAIGFEKQKSVIYGKRIIEDD